MGQQYGIHRVEKVKGGSGIGGLQQEEEREKDYPGSDIDHSRTKDNLVLMDETQGKRWQQYVHEQIAAVGCRVRKDSVRTITAIYTASPDYMTSLSKEQQLSYFQDCLAWHERTYGKAFYAIIHMDEKTPHMHVTGIPFQEREGGKIVLSAKTCLGGRKALAQKQESFYQEICAPRGLDHHHVREPHQQREHLSCLEYKVQQEEQRLLDQIERLLPEPEPGQDMIAAKERLLSRLFGRDEVIVSRQELDRLQQQAEQAPQLAAERDAAIREKQDIRKQADQIYRDATQQAEARLRDLQWQQEQLEDLIEDMQQDIKGSSPLEQIKLIYDMIGSESDGLGLFDKLNKQNQVDIYLQRVGQTLLQQLSPEARELIEPTKQRHKEKGLTR